jgi:hypothetical protein
MQITINAPDNLPQAFIQQQIKELEAKFKQQANRLTTKISDKDERYLAMKKISEEYASLPVLDPRSADEILGYDQSPMGLWGDE